MTEEIMDENRPYRVRFAPGILEGMSEEDRQFNLDAAATLEAEMNLAGGVDKMLGSSDVRAVVFVNMGTARCEVCRGVLVRDQDDPSEYVCNMTSACRGYVYLDEDTDEARAAIAAYDALTSDDDDHAERN